MMFRLGLHLTLRSGREAFVRLLVTAAAVAVGVAIMLAVLADFHAFQVTSNRPSWESTQGQPVSSNYASATSSELWSYGDDVYQGQTIERLDVAGLGRKAPVLPGISRLPGSGQYYASPALAALIRSTPADELGDRFPGRLAGTIGQQALTGPDELVAYVGYAPGQLANMPTAMVVGKIATAPAQELWTNFFRGAFVVGVIALLFPILILLSTATRLAASRREERYAALRLVGATSSQIGVISSVDAVVSALIGAILGTGIFALLQPALAGTAITSARYFSDEVTPTAAGYLIVLVGVPIASAVSSVLSLRRVRISPLGVIRRMRPSPPTAWRMVPLLAGVVVLIAGLHLTSRKSISPAALAGLIVILIGLVIGGPWLTAQAARLLSRVANGASALLAARRLADNPKAAFRSVSGLVLAVFLGTVVAGLLPAVDSTVKTPSASALSNVLLDGFVFAPVCGNNVNCNAVPAPGQVEEGTTRFQHLISLEGMPPREAATLVRGLKTIDGAAVIPIYSIPQDGDFNNPPEPGAPDAVVSCASLRQLAALGHCAAGRHAVEVWTGRLFDDNPHFSTQAIASPSSPAASDNLTKLYLQLVLIKVNSPATLERVRTYLATHVVDSLGDIAPRTFGEAVQVRTRVAMTVQRLVDIGVLLTLLVAGCSLAVTVGGGLVERKRPFTLLRVAGTATSTLYGVVLLEAVLPLAAATLVVASIGYGISALTVRALAPAGTPVPTLGHVYYLTIGAGLVASLLIILMSLPLLGRITGPGSARFE
jgi:hypothetical protein